ncbi:MAG TPA: nitrate- and nitrite sensing domain-containing protein, partial [Acidimicrobiales bacterium]
MRRIPIRLKLAAALAVPLLALAALTAYEVVSTARAVGEIREQTELARSAIGPAGLITTLQNERTWTLVELVGFESMLTGQTEGYDQNRADTDASIAAFREEITSRGGRVAEAYGETLDGLEQEVQAIRADVDAFTAPRTLSNLDFARSVFERYTALVVPLFDATTRVAYDVNDAELRQGAQLADTVTRQIETMSQLLIETLASALVSPGGVDEPAEIDTISGLHADFQHLNDVMRSATGVYGEIAEEWFPTDLVENADAIVEEAITTGRIGNLDRVLASMNVPRDEGYVGYQEAVHAAINERADHLNDSAEARRLWLSALAVLALGA